MLGFINLLFYRYHAVVYLGILLVVTFVVAFYFWDTGITDERVGSALFYTITNLTITAKSPVQNRSMNYRVMMAITKSHFILHSLGLVFLMIWVSLPASVHPDHWANTNKMVILANLPWFYAICGVFIVFGVVSILTLMWLRTQVMEMDKKSGRKLWDPTKRDNH